MTNLTGVSGLLTEALPGIRSATSRPKRLATPVIEDFVDQIVGGNFPPGTDLPSEANICNYLGISRTVLREVLKVLEQKGLVQVENGKGTFVTERDRWKLLDPVVLSARLRHDSDRSFLDHLVSVRVALETEMSREAALAATPEELSLMSAAIEELKNSLKNPETYREADEHFHDLIMQASRNELGRAIVRSVYLEAHSTSHYKAEDVHLEPSLRGHINIYEAIADHDPERAAEATRAHISDSWLRTNSPVVSASDPS